MLRDATEQTIISVSGKFAAGGSVTAVGSGVAGKTMQIAAADPEIISSAIVWADIGVIFGIVVGALGLLAQLFFHIRRDRRETKLFTAEMEKMGSSK